MTSEGFSSLRTGGKGLPLFGLGPGGLLPLLPDPARNHIQENLNIIFGYILLIVGMLELMVSISHGKLYPLATSPESYLLAQRPAQNQSEPGMLPWRTLQSSRFGTRIPAESTSLSFFPTQPRFPLPPSRVACSHSGQTSKTTEGNGCPGF